MIFLGSVVAKLEIYHGRKCVERVDREILIKKRIGDERVYAVMTHLKTRFTHSGFECGIVRLGAFGI